MVGEAQPGGGSGLRPPLENILKAEGLGGPKAPGRLSEAKKTNRGILTSYLYSLFVSSGRPEAVRARGLTPPQPLGVAAGDRSGRLLKG